jgi:hypothetical protein
MLRSERDIRYQCENCGTELGLVEGAIRRSVDSGDMLSAWGGRGRFTVVSHTPGGLILEDEKGTPTLLPWSMLNQVTDFLRRRGGVPIRNSSTQESLHDYLKTFSEHMIAELVARVLEKAGVAGIDYVRPESIWVRSGW